MKCFTQRFYFFTVRPKLIFITCQAWKASSRIILY